MGFFTKLFGLSKEEEELDEDSIEQWFREKTRVIVSSSEKSKEEIRQSFEQKIIEIKEALNVLENAKLQNPNVPIRTLDFMHGNRENYIKQVNLLLNSMPELKEDFESKFNFLLDDFSKRTTRSYQILNEFFSHETKDIALKIKEGYGIALDYITPDPEVANINNVLDKFKNIESNKKLAVELKEKINDLQNKSIEEEKKVVEISQSLEEMRDSPESERLIVLNETIKQTERRLNEIEVSVINMFSPFSKLIRRHERQSEKFGKLLKDYDRDSLKTFEDDNQMNIIDAINEGVQNAEALGFSDKECEKLRERKSALNVLELANIKGEYKKIRRDLQNANDELSKITLEEDIGSLQKEERNLREKIQETKNEIDKLYNKIRIANDENMNIKLDLPSLIEKITGEKIRVK